MLHFLPCLAAAAAGAAITYIAKDRETRNRFRNSADKVADGVRDGVDRTARAARALTRPRPAKTKLDANSDATPTTH